MAWTRVGKFSLNHFKSPAHGGNLHGTASYRRHKGVFSSTLDEGGGGQDAEEKRWE
jgi:hypothetical protein